MPSISIIGNSINDRDGSAVEVSVSLPSRRAYTVTGLSKRKPADTPDLVLGERIALSRALRNLADQLYREPEPVKEADPQVEEVSYRVHSRLHRPARGKSSRFSSGNPYAGL